ncbi:MAG: hypothetical protein KBT22_12170 [Bacteroidales bacterium]|nr:hypothetical protein [Candidatus Scybalocola fimicaballi]
MFYSISAISEVYGEEPCKVTSDLTIDKLGIALEGDQGICLKDYGAQFKVTYDDREVLDGATYTISFTDGSNSETYTVQQLKELGGIITHKFNKSSCSVSGKMFTATVAATTCNSNVHGSSDLKTVRVLKGPTADFSVSEKVCINKPFSIYDNTTSGETYSCTSAHYSDWYFDDGSNLLKQETLSVSHTFTTLGKHKIKLKVYSLDPPKECNYDSIEKIVEVVADPILNPIDDIEVCAGAKVDSIPLSGTNVAKVEWDYGTSVGLYYGSATKPLKIPGFIAKNGGSSVIEKEIVVTPYNEAGCEGDPVKFKVKVKPSPEIKDIDDVMACDGETVKQVNFEGLVPNTTFAWEIVEDGNIGLTQKSGNTNFVPAFMANSNEKSATTKIKVTASNSDPNLAMCPGETKTFEYKVSPAPVFTVSVDSITKCGSSDGKIYLNGLVANSRYYVTFNGDVNAKWTDDKGTITLFPVKPGTYKDIKVEFGNCDYTSSDIITLKAPSAPATPVVSVENSNLCEGDTLKFTAVAEEGVSYRWEGPGFWTSSEQNPRRVNAKVSNSGKYLLYVVKNSCESAIAEVDVNVAEKPSVEIVNLPTSTNGVCGSYLFTKEKNLDIKVEDGITSVEWSVEPSDGVSFSTNANDLSTNIQFDKFGTYNIALKYVTSCGEEETSGVVKIDEPIQMTLTPVGPVCANIVTEQNDNGIALQAEPKGGTWSLSSHKDWIEGSSFYANEPGNYYVVYSVKVASCTATDSILINVKDYPDLNLGDDVSVCEGQTAPIALTANPSGGSWGGNYVSGNMFNPPTEVGTYKVSYVYQDENGCKSYDEKNITVLPIPSPEFGPEFICLPNEAEFVPVADKNYQFFFDYGDGTKDNSGKHLYSKKGRYDVKLVVTASNGCVDSLVKNVEVNEIVNSKFALDTIDGCSPLYVEITPSYTEDDSLGTTFKWQIGSKMYDSPFLEKQEFTAHTFDSTYIIKSTVKNVCGTSVYEDSVIVYATVYADFEMDFDKRCAPLKVIFQNKTQGTMTGVSYLWDFGDGETSTERFLFHNFKGSMTEAITYNIKLIAYNKCGADSIIKPLYVLPQNIKAQFSSDPKLGCTDTEICFSNNSVGMSEEDPISRVAWDFGNDEVSNEWNGCTRFKSAGLYHVKLVVNNTCGRDEYESVIEISEKPKVKIEAKESICIGDSLTPKFSSDVSIKGINWSFGDGTTSSLMSPSHIYGESNKYMLRLDIVANNDGECKASDSIEIVVPESAIPEISPLEFSGCSPLVYEPEFDNAYHYKIDYEGDGNWTSRLSHNYINNSYEPIHYMVNIIAENGYGCKTKQRGIVSVSPQPVAKIRKAVQEGNPEIVTLYNISEHYHDNNCTWTLPFSGVQNTCDSVREEFFGNEEQIMILHIENSYQCFDEDTISHKPMMKGLYFPNTFIPGSEDDAIATFNGVGIGIKEYLLEIFDLYGNLVYSTSSLNRDGSPDQGWDGTDRHGKLMPQDVYSWRARAIYEDGSVYPFGNSVAGKETYQRGSVLLLIK